MGSPIETVEPAATHDTFAEAAAAVPEAIGRRWSLVRIDDSAQPPIAVFQRSGLRVEPGEATVRATETLAGFGYIASYVSGRPRKDGLSVAIAGPGKGGAVTKARAQVLLAVDGHGEPVPFPEDFSAERLRSDIEAALGLEGKLLQLACDEHPCLAVLSWKVGTSENFRAAFYTAMVAFGHDSSLVPELGVVVGGAGPLTLAVASWGSPTSERITLRAAALEAAAREAARSLSR